MNQLHSKLFILLVTVITLTNCKSSADNGDLSTINLSLINAAEGQVAYLEDINGPTPVMIDTAKLEGSKLKLEGDVAPGIYRLKLPVKGGMTAAILFLDKGDNIDMNFDIEKPNDYKISGNKESQLIQKALKDRDDIIQTINGVNENVRSAQNQAQRDSLNEVMTGLITNMSNNVKETIENNKDIDPNTTALLLSLLVPQTDQQYIVAELKKCLEIAPDAGFVKRMAQQYQLVEGGKQPTPPAQVEQGLAVGVEAPEINQPSPTGKDIALSSLRGKYVLVDFWAAWCKPCRFENPNVVRTYNAYKDKGFEVYSVSLDKSRDAWLKAIEKDGLVWESHVSDLKAWSSQPARDYGVRGIPATFLLDPEGKIIAKNLRGPALEAKLAEVLN